MTSHQSANSNHSSSSIIVNEPAKITLEIENFAYSRYGNATLNLPSNNQIQFNLEVCPKFNFTFCNQNHTYIYLTLTKSPKDQIFMRCKFSILNKNNDECMTQEKVENFSKTKNRVYGFYQINYDYLMDSKNGLLLNGKLTIYCEIAEIDPQNSSLSRNDSSPKIISNPVLENYQSLLESGKFSDVTLIIGEKKLLAHKTILAAQSKVFAAMFENDCEEKRQNRVEITDVPIEVCELMLRYIYTGNIPELSADFTGELFVAADKYQLDYLKVSCEQLLSSSIDVESVTSTLLVADMHSATLLKTKCIEFIVEHAKNVIKTEGWKHLAKTRPDLAVQLFESLTNKK